MFILVLLVSIQFLCRLSFQTIPDAVVSTLFLLLFIAICYRWGGWTSARSGIQWLDARWFAILLITSGVAGVVGTALYDGRFRPMAIIAEAIGAFFVFYASCAIGDLLIRRLRKTQQRSGAPE